MSIPRPDYPRSEIIKTVAFDSQRIRIGSGDMWACAWGADDNIYAASGDTKHPERDEWSVMCLFKVIGPPGSGMEINLQNFEPVDKSFAITLPETHVYNNLKPGGLISIKGRLYLSVSSMNYGEAAHGFRQRYPNCWIAFSDDFGLTWDYKSVPYDFFSGRLCGPTFVQFGKDNDGARDKYAYACFPCSYRGVSYWENQDCLLMGRVQADSLLERGAWEFRTRDGGWDRDDTKAAPVFEYPVMTGQDFIQYNKGLGRYILGNYSFMSPRGVARPYHTGEFTDCETKYPSQLTLFEAPEPWGPWSLFHIDDNWGAYGDYQPSFPVKWMSDNGLVMHMVSSGSYDDYRFIVQRVLLNV